jgi:hypothetical protein
VTAVTVSMQVTAAATTAAASVSVAAKFALQCYQSVQIACTPIQELLVAEAVVVVCAQMETFRVHTVSAVQNVLQYKQ